MIARLPDSLASEGEKGGLIRSPAHLIDFMATFLELSGAEYRRKIGYRHIPPLEGRSLMPLIRGEKRVPHDPLYFHFGTDRALRSGDWKLVSAKCGKWELYDLAEDRTELNDLASKYPERVQKMAAQWFEIAKNKDRLKGGQLRAVSEEFTPLKFGKRKDPPAKKNQGK
jgi:arylsulfatase